ncbi:unnamed protein product [Caretta caretta]
MGAPPLPGITERRFQGRIYRMLENRSNHSDTLHQEYFLAGQPLSGHARAMTPDELSQGNTMQAILYGALVLLCLLSNSLVLLTVLAMTVKHSTMAASDLLLATLSTINLLLTALWNTLIL